MAHLLINKQFETIWDQVRLQAITEKPEHPMQTVTLTEIIPSVITLEISPSLKDFKTKKHSKSARSPKSCGQCLTDINEQLFDKGPGCK